jgi:hypothetical protein
MATVHHLQTIGDYFSAPINVTLFKVVVWGGSIVIP